MSVETKMSNMSVETKKRNKNKILKKAIAIIQECYSFFVVIYCGYHILFSFSLTGGCFGHWDAERRFLFTGFVISIVINIALFIFAELISKPEIEGVEDSPNINKRDGIKKEVFILVLNCIFFLLALAVFLVMTWGAFSFLSFFLFFLTNTPLFIIVILTSILLKQSFKSKETKEN